MIDCPYVLFWNPLNGSYFPWGACCVHKLGEVTDSMTVESFDTEGELSARIEEIGGTPVDSPYFDIPDFETP